MTDDDAAAADADSNRDASSTRDAADGQGLEPAEQRAAVRERYGRIAADSGPCCGGDGSNDGGLGAPELGDSDDGCCESGSEQSAEHAKRLGYADDDLAAVEPGANLGLGCGNPTAIAGLAEGDAVLDLGAGGGFDCFLAAREVGPTGRVVGVDMTPEMVERARENAAANDASTVEFRLGEIEHLPVADEAVDVVLSNCVVNLSPDKPQVFREAHRVLRPGGRLAISDVVLTAELPGDRRADPASVAACVGGASPVPELESMLADAGFENVSVEPDDDSAALVSEWDPDRDLSDYVVAATIEGRKPAT